ncbi:hypothetical protein BpHYR1_000893 [Brachionus plicatilis]|uniref:Uncharacterized protein n=1 Tax=Brachionus plicatilis TaxID=10195 RepID=A0A3M7SFH0_BRAPC|nr:hypothetical protein BpHYR1_000893 [Brachionus plicatilis]
MCSSASCLRNVTVLSYNRSPSHTKLPIEYFMYLSSLTSPESVIVTFIFGVTTVTIAEHVGHIAFLVDAASTLGNAVLAAAPVIHGLVGATDPPAERLARLNGGGRVHNVRRVGARRLVALDHYFAVAVVVHLGNVHVFHLRAEFARDLERTDGTRAVHVYGERQIGVVRVDPLLHPRHLVVETRERMLAGVAHGTAVAGPRTIAPKVVPRLKTGGAVLTRIGRAFVQYFARVDKNAYADHVVVSAGQGTVFERADVLRRYLSTVV